MVRLFGKKKGAKEETVSGVTDGMAKAYKSKLFPVEDAFKFHEFHSPAHDEGDFDAKPLILLIGQYSTGKTTFIRYLLEEDFPAMRVGPEPTTDRFTIVMHSESTGTMPGNALVVDPGKPFRGLNKFGNTFLNRLQASMMDNKALETLTFIDTPGILSGEKQRTDRGYDFVEVIKWFAERVDRILLLFDAHKLDISDEFKQVIEALKFYEHKIRIVLNKADRIDYQQLMRVYGALMWSLGKVLGTPEVARVYIGSFWDEPLHYDVNRALFELERKDLFMDLQMLPRTAIVRKMNDLIGRAKLAKVHALVMMQLRKDLPSFGKEKAKTEMMKNLPQIYIKVSREHNIPLGDFPDVEVMREHLATCDLTKIPKERQKAMDQLEVMLTKDLPHLMSRVPEEESLYSDLIDEGTLGNRFDMAEGFDEGQDESDTWIIEQFRPEYDAIFESMNPVNGMITGAQAKEHLLGTRLPNSTLARIWRLVDFDNSGQFDKDQWALCLYIVKLKLAGHELPRELPDHLMPPGRSSGFGSKKKGGRR